jgi:hypothetical protein
MKRERPVRIPMAHMPSEARLADVHARLRLRYPAKEFALFHEVRSSVGLVGSPRYADAIVMGLWPSRGLTLEGLEVKVDRRDWLRELRNPKKADDIARYCDHWWLVTSSPDIAEVCELPENWGWLVPSGRTFRVAKPASRLKPVPIDRPFLASIFRAAACSSATAAALEAAAREHELSRDQALEWQKQRLDREGRELREAVAKFERESGLVINSWSGEEIGKKVAGMRALEASGDSVVAALERAVRSAERDLERLREAHGALRGEFPNLHPALEAPCSKTT